MTEIIKIDNQFYNDDVIKNIVKTIKNGKIIIMPSDTIYGFLCLPELEEELRILKKRDEKPFLYLISNFEDLNYFKIEYKSKIDLLKRNWPGPFTFLLKNIENNIYGFRLPDWEVLRKIINQIGSPLISTSVNYSGQAAMNDINEIKNEFNNKVDLIVDDCLFKANIASSIIDISEKTYKIIRKGSAEFRF